MRPMRNDKLLKSESLLQIKKLFIHQTNADKSSLKIIQSQSVRRSSEF